MRCHLVKSEQQWKEEKSCENCPFLEERELSVMEFTTQHIEGVCAITEPSESWLAKYLNTNNFIPGIYCIRVKLLFSQDIIESL